MSNYGTMCGYADAIEWVAQLMNGKNQIRKYKDLKKQDDDLMHKIKKRGQQLKEEHEKGSFTE